MFNSPRMRAPASMVAHCPGPQLSISSDSHAAQGVSLAFALEGGAPRDQAFRSVMIALLHAGGTLGHAYPAHIVSAYDVHGEHYAPPITVPAASYPTLPQTLEILDAIDQRYHRVIGMSLTVDETIIPVTCRVYDDGQRVAVRLDLHAGAWAKLIHDERSVRAATRAILNTGRTLFTLLPVRFLLIGPAALLQHALSLPQPYVLRRTPIVMLGEHDIARAWNGSATCMHERVPRGHVLVRAWDASREIGYDVPTRVAGRI